jgi:hypothetical protein
MKQTRQILVAHPGSRVDAYVIECVREMMRMKQREINREANKKGLGCDESSPMGTC